MANDVEVKGKTEGAENRAAEDMSGASDDKLSGAKGAMERLQGTAKEAFGKAKAKIEELKHDHKKETAQEKP